MRVRELYKRSVLALVFEDATKGFDAIPEVRLFGTGLGPMISSYAETACFWSKLSSPKAQFFVWRLNFVVSRDLSPSVSVGGFHFF